MTIHEFYYLLIQENERRTKKNITQKVVVFNQKNKNQKIIKPSATVLHSFLN